MPPKATTDDLELFTTILPPRIRVALAKADGKNQLVEVILDLGRLPAIRSNGQEVQLGRTVVSPDDISYVTDRIGEFGGDNRAGIERTLHRISALRNRSSDVIGLTCRVGRAVFGTAEIIRDLIESGKSILILGRPGVGKTTILRETARILSDDLHKRVVIVDTSNEIAGDGDIPHPAIGSARRMQVAHPSEQHQVMIEAVENHMPEVIVIDEMGTIEESQAARTIAERGVQLIATAHGNTLENLIQNPTLNDLVGGIQSVTLGDEEAKKRGTQKSVLERRAPPTFDIVVEILERDRLSIHLDVSSAVDILLRGTEPAWEKRQRTADGTIVKETSTPKLQIRDDSDLWLDKPAAPPVRTYSIFPLGVSRKHILAISQKLGLSIQIAPRVQDADMVFAQKKDYRKRGPSIRQAESDGIPLYVIKDNIPELIESFQVSLIED